MKILGLVSENVKRISAVNLRPDGSFVQISGENEQGKSSVLDSIWLALDYAEAVKRNPRPLKDGTNHGRTEIDLGEMIVTRTFDRKADGGHTTAIKVMTREGAAFPKPQATLDALVGKLAMDPIEFLEKKPREQFDILSKFVPGVDFAAMEKANQADRDRRTEVNRLAGQTRASAELIALPENMPAEIPDISELTARLASAATHNQKISERILNRQKVAQAAQSFREEANRKAEEAQTLLARAGVLQEESTALMDKSETELARVAKAPELPKPIDTKDLAERIEQARGLEKLFQRRQERNQRMQQAEELEATSNELTAAIKARDAAKEEAISDAKLPVEGLSLGDGIVLLNGVPLEQVSGEQKVMVSAAIAMASNPKLRVFLIRRGSDLDSKHRAILAKIVEENDYQCWCELVDESGQIGFVIEDGMLKGAPAAEAVPEKAAARSRSKANGRAPEPTAIEPKIPAHPVDISSGDDDL